MAKARAALYQKMRDRVLADNPELTGDEVERRVDQLVREKNTRAGRKGGAGNRRNILAFKLFKEQHATLVAQAEGLLAQAKDLVVAVQAAADPQAHCDHDWPGELDEDAYCQRCGLPYPDWSEDVPETADPTEAGRVVAAVLAGYATSGAS
jgi:hypothetical protein